MAYFYDEYGNQRLVNPTYGSVPPLGTPVYEDDQPSLPATDLPQLPQFGQSPRPAVQRPSLGQPLSMQIPSLGLPEQVGNSPNYDGAPPQQLGSGVDPNNVPISPSMFGSSMFQTAEQEMDFNDAVRRGDSAKVRELIQQADKYAKDKAKRDAITNMVNTAVMAGLGIAAGAPGSYGDFGTQVARGALTGINYATAMQNQESLDDYRQGQLQNARARALSYQQQVENSRRNTNLKESSTQLFKAADSTGTMRWWLRSPYHNGAILATDRYGRPLPAGDQTAALLTNKGWHVVNKSTNEAIPLFDSTGGQLYGPPFTEFTSEIDPQTGQPRMVAVTTDPGGGTPTARVVTREPGSGGPMAQVGQTIAPGGQVITGSPDKVPFTEAESLQMVERFRAALPNAPDYIRGELDQLVAAIRTRPSAFTPKVLDDRLNDIRTRYDKYVNSGVGMAERVLGTNASPTPSPVATPTPGPPASLPPASQLGAPLVPAPQPPTPTPPPRPTPTPAPAWNQLQVDALIQPIAAGNGTVSDAIRILTNSLGMSEQQARLAVTEYMTRTNP